MAIEVPRPKMPFKDRMGSGRKDLVHTTLWTKMLRVVYSDSWVTVRNIFNVTEKSYGTVEGCTWEHLNMKTINTRLVPRLLTAEYKSHI